MNTQANTSTSPSPRRRSGFHAVGTLILLILAGAGGWYGRGLHDSAQAREQAKAALDAGVKRVEGALSKQNLEEAEHKLGELKAVAEKDTRIAALESRLLAAKVAKAVSDGQLDDAKQMLQKAEKDGSATADQIKKWRDQVSAAEAQKSASSASSSSAAASSSSKSSKSSSKPVAAANQP